MLRGLLLIPLLALGVAVGCGDAVGGGRALVPEGEPQVRVTSAGLLVAGEIRNTNTERPYTGTLQVVLKDAQGKIVGSAVGGVDGVPPGGTLPYTAAGAAPTGPWERVEVAVTAAVPTPR